MGQQHDFYLVQSGNLVPRAALWRGFLACFQQPSLLRPANLDSSDLKYEFRVAAGHDPNEIRFFYEGADTFVNEAGQIEVTTPVGGFVDERPYAYQVVGRKRLAVPVSYSETALSDDAAVYGFQLGAYDPRHPIIIDPAVLVYAGYIGGSAQDEAYGVDVDADGNAYIVGTTKSSEMTFR